MDTRAKTANDVLASAGDAFVFFFSSRRRHTRFDCDWSSDVCSSDLSLACCSIRRGKINLRVGGCEKEQQLLQKFMSANGHSALGARIPQMFCSSAVDKIGRASCRERV